MHSSACKFLHIEETVSMKTSLGSFEVSVLLKFEQGDLWQPDCVEVFQFEDEVYISRLAHIIDWSKAESQRGLG